MAARTMSANQRTSLFGNNSGPEGDRMPCAAVVRVGIPQTGAGWGGAERVGGGD